MCCVIHDVFSTIKVEVVRLITPEIPSSGVLLYDKKRAQKIAPSEMVETKF